MLAALWSFFLVSLCVDALWCMFFVRLAYTALHVVHCQTLEVGVYITITRRRTLRHAWIGNKDMRNKKCKNARMRQRM